MKRLTERVIRSLPAGDYPDTEQGLQLRVSGSGDRQWSVRYRLKGKQRRDSLGYWPKVSLSDAREKARETVSSAKSGQDPRGDDTEYRFRDLWEDYYQRHALRKKRASSAAEDLRMAKKDLLPVWGERRPSDIARPEAARLLDGIAQRTEVHANRVRALGSKIFAFGVAHGLTEGNPFQGLPRASKETPRSRFLSEEEVGVLWRFLDERAIWNPETKKKGSVTAIGMQLALLTLARNNELCGWRWDEIDGSWWTVPETRTKSGREHRVFLTPLTRSLLDRLDLGISQFVLHSPQSKTGHVVKLRPSRQTEWPVEDWSPHDLRRTGATAMARLGVQPHVRELCLGHVLQGVGWTYDRWSYEPEIQTAFERLSSWVSSVARGHGGQVVSISR